MAGETFNCYLVDKDASGNVSAGVAQRLVRDLPAGEVLIRVSCSSLNYKDAMAATGHPGVIRQFPHVPGIDAAGVVVESTAREFTAGDRVICTSYELGAGRWGGWSELIRVPAEWVVPLPDRLTFEESMIYGTAGLTAALSVDALQRHDVRPASGDIVVTGATGGVGMLSVMLLAKLGYRAVAATGKKTQHERLLQLGAARVVGRDEVNSDSPKPLLAARWAGAIDTVGGNTLAALLRETDKGGCVAACGLVGGHELQTTVYPFILRGVTLTGIDSAWADRQRRIELWRRLANEWKLDELSSITARATFADVGGYVNKILRGELTGRVVVVP